MPPLNIMSPFYTAINKFCIVEGGSVDNIRFFFVDERLNSYDRNSYFIDLSILENSSEKASHVNKHCVFADEGR